MKFLKPADLLTGTTLGGQAIARVIDIPTTLPANGGDADTIEGYGPEDFAPIAHVGSGGSAHSLATTTTAGFFDPNDKTKLNAISTQANKTTQSATNGNVLIDGVETVVYTHPSTHAATMITEDSTHRFVTDAEKTTWNAKQSALGFTPENVANKGAANGYASLGADSKIPSGQLPTNVFAPIAHVGTGGSEHALATQTTAGFQSSSDKAKLDGISLQANKTAQSATNGNVLVDGAQIVVYAHPSTHPATMITEDSTHRFVTDTEKSTWNGKQAALGFTPENTSKKGAVNGYASLDAAGKIPLAQLPDTAKQQTYIVADNTEMNALTGLVSGDKAFQTATGDSYIYNGTTWILMADADWANVSLTWANISGKPSSTPADIDSAVTSRHSHSNKAVLDATTASFTTALNTKLTGIADNANNYVHPANHPASIITQDASNRFVTDTEKATWNGKQAALGYTPLNPANNLSEVTNAATARTNLGLTGNSNTTHYHDGQYYTKTQLNTSGQGAAVHWGNVTNAPTSMPANGGNADTIDGLNADQFLRSDTDDTMTGSLTVTGNVVVQGTIGFGNDSNAIVVNDSNNEARTGYYSGSDSFTFQMDGAITNTVIKTAHVDVTNVYASEKIGVNKFSMEYNATEQSLDFVFTP